LLVVDTFDTFASPPLLDFGSCPTETIDDLDNLLAPAFEALDFLLFLDLQDFFFPLPPFPLLLLSIPSSKLELVLLFLPFPLLLIGQSSSSTSDVVGAGTGAGTGTGAGIDTKVKINKMTEKVRSASESSESTTL